MADEQTILISDPLFSREAVSQYVHKTDKFSQHVRWENVKSYLNETNMATEIEEVSKKCPACGKNYETTCKM